MNNIKTVTILLEFITFLNFHNFEVKMILLYSADNSLFLSKCRRCRWQADKIDEITDLSLSYFWFCQRALKSQILKFCIIVLLNNHKTALFFTLLNTTLIIC